MRFLKIKKIKFLAFFVAMLLSGLILGRNTYAATSTFTASDGSIWLYEIDSSGYLTIGFSDTTNPNVTSVKVPGLDEIATAVGDASISELETYFVNDLRTIKTTSLTSPNNLQTVDMTNTSKVQMKSLSPLFDRAEGTVELKFGENMVIKNYYDNRKSDVSENTSTWQNKGMFEGVNATLKLTDLQKVKYVGFRTFYGVTLSEDSRDVTIANGQKYGQNVFAGSNIKSLTVHSNEVPPYVCEGATDLTSITIGDEVEVIQGSAFRNTTSLSQDIDTNKVKTINALAFEGSAITGLTFGDNLESVFYQAFKDTRSINKPLNTNNVIGFDIESFYNSSLPGLTVSDKTKIFGQSSFTNTNLGKLDFTGKKPAIGVWAFKNAGITELKLGNIVVIDHEAFRDNSFSEVYVPKTYRGVIRGCNSVKYSYGSSDVSNCYDNVDENPNEGDLTGINKFTNDNMKKITIAYDLTASNAGMMGVNIGVEFVGLNDSTVEELVLEAPYEEGETPSRFQNKSSVTSRENSYNGTGYLAPIVSTSKNIISPFAFYNMEGIKKLTIGEGYEIIGHGAFGNGFPMSSYPITELNLPSTLKAIGSEAFINSLGGGTIELEELPDGIEYIGAASFYSMNSYHPDGFKLETFDLPELKFVGQSAFTNAKIKNLALRNKLECVWMNAFTENEKLENLTIDFDIWKSGMLQGTASGGNITGALFTNWLDPNKGMVKVGDDITKASHKFKNVTFTGNAVTPIASAAHANMVGLEADVLDLSATPWEVIDDTRFAYVKVDTLVLPSNLKTIDHAAFYYTEVTKPVELPNTLQTIGAQAFAKSNIKISEIPESVTTIKQGAFFEASNVTADVNLPNLAFLGNSAFQGSSVRDVILSDSIETLGLNVFFDVPTLRNVTIDTDLYGYDDDHKQKETTILFELNKIITQLKTAKATELGRELTEEEEEEIEELHAYNQDFYRSFSGTFGHNHKYGKIKFTSKAGEPCGGFENCKAKFAYFADLEAEEVDLSETNWDVTSHSMFQGSNIDKIILPNGLKTVGQDSFYQVNVHEIVFPETLETIEEEGFQWAKGDVSTLPEGLKTIKRSAFFGSDLTDNLVIPSTVTNIGKDAFNAGDEDVYYDTVTIRPDLTYDNTSDQPIFVVFYGNTVKKLIIDSADLPTLHANDGISEFHAMAVEEAVINNLPKISDNAFEECQFLERVDMSSDADLRAIGNEAFINAEKFNNILFSDAIENEVVTIGRNAFQGTAFRTIGDQFAEINLNAAKFDASAGQAFANMPKLHSVRVVEKFSDTVVPQGTFYNDGELETAIIDYRVSKIDKGAFTDDNKLKSIFIWGNTEILDDNITGERTRGVNYGPTIPGVTDIYAYSVAPAEEFAADSSRDEFTGVFYPLDEVLYLTSNKPTIMLDEDEDDFDKDGLTVYALRRDGVILQSDEWGVFNGTPYSRIGTGIEFENMAAIQADRPEFGAVYDTPVPLDLLDFGNENFQEIGFALIPDEEHEGMRKVELIYTDKYTRGESNTDLLPAEPPCEGDDCPCVGDDCPCEGDDCEEPDPECEGDDCPCEGDDCEDPDPECEGDDCPCEGDDCEEPDPECEGDDCPCEGDDCDEPDPECEGDDCPCEGDDCDEPKPTPPTPDPEPTPTPKPKPIPAPNTNIPEAKIDIAVPNTGDKSLVSTFVTTGLPIAAIITTVSTGAYFGIKRIKSSKK